MLKTQQQKENLCTECSIAKTADLVGDSVILLIVRDLLQGDKKFSELARALDGISSRTLTNKLKYLVETNIIEKNNTLSVYRLTPKGKSLKKVIISMRDFGRDHL